VTSPAPQANPVPSGPASPSPLQSQWWDVAFGVMCLVVFGGLLWLGSGTTFFADGWSFIAATDRWSIDMLMQPHNEHWMLGLKLIYLPLLEVFGLSTYLPYLFVLLLLHVATAAALYVYAQRETVAFIAFAIGSVFLLLGSGGDNFFHAFQIGWSGSVAAGTWALVVLLREPPLKWAWLAALLLLVSVATTGVGLFFVAAATALTVLSPTRRRYLWVVLPAVVAYAAWYVAYGSDAVRSISELGDVIDFVRVGIAHAFGAISGLGSELGLILGVLFGIAAIANILLSDVLRLGLIAGSVGLLTQYVLTGMARAQVAVETAMAPRYVYPAAVFILIALIGFLAFRRLDVPGRRLRLFVAVTVLAVLAVAWNTSQIHERQEYFTARAMETRAAVVLLLRYGGTPAIPSDRGMGIVPDLGELTPVDPGEGVVIPGRERLSAIVQEMGSPVTDRLALQPVRVPGRTLDTLFSRLVRDEVGIESTTEPPAPQLLWLEDSQSVTLEWDGSCAVLFPESAGGSITYEAASGTGLHVSTDTWGVGELFLTLHGSGGIPGVAHEANPDSSTRIRLPDIGPDAVMLVRYVPPEGGSTTVCTEA
jgi:hypothetical protein